MPLCNHFRVKFKEDTLRLQFYTADGESEFLLNTDSAMGLHMLLTQLLQSALDPKEYDKQAENHIQRMQLAYISDQMKQN